MYCDGSLRLVPVVAPEAGKMLWMQLRLYCITPRALIEIRRPSDHLQILGPVHAHPAVDSTELGISSKRQQTQDPQLPGTGPPQLHEQHVVA